METGEEVISIAEYLNRARQSKKQETKCPLFYTQAEEINGKSNKYSNCPMLVPKTINNNRAEDSEMVDEHDRHMSTPKSNKQLS